MTYPRLTEENCSIEGNTAANKKLLEAGMLPWGDIDTMFDEFHAAEAASSNNFKEGCWDDYNMAGDMINVIMSMHPKLKEAWNEMSADEKWLFVEAIHYGVDSKIRREVFDKKAGAPHYHVPEDYTS